MGNYSKLFGSVIGSLFGIAVSQWGLPETFASPEIQAGTITLFGAAFTYFFPANVR